MKIACRMLALFAFAPLAFGLMQITAPPVTGSIEGIVSITGSDQPLAGVMVYGPSRGGGRSLEEINANIPKSLTDDSGQFRLADLPPNRYAVSFEAAITSRNFRIVAENGGIKQWPTTPDDPTGNNYVPVLYPGTGELVKAQWIEVRGGEEIRLNPVVVGPQRLGTVRLRLTNPPGEIPKTITLTFQNATKGIDFATLSPSSLPVAWGQNEGGESIKLESREATRTYWPPRIGTYEIRASWKSAGGEEMRVSKRIHFNGAGMDTSMDLSQPDGVLELRVLLEEGIGPSVPVAGIRPVLCDSNTRACLPLEAMGITGADGVVKLRSVATGVYDLSDLFGLPEDLYVSRALQAQRNVLAGGVTVDRNSTVVEIAVRRGKGSVEGVLLDEKGDAVANGAISILPDPQLGRSQLQAVYRGARTNAEGRFSFMGVSPGNYRIAGIREFEIPETPLETNMAERGLAINVQETQDLKVELKLTGRP